MITKETAPAGGWGAEAVGVFYCAERNMHNEATIALGCQLERDLLDYNPFGLVLGYRGLCHARERCVN